ncbi:TPA: hypothetical protein N0F65_006320 [Lagenidium giganteum]|uniref:Uncharacterized protein n=1 Tax=Lagenidium giganteum TaxID=4803 RepID=A0AAV2YMV2_9STRA|nr:TPA: hypothetical protein N0F65_006320 [Lagenidium giganteum]
MIVLEIVDIVLNLLQLTLPDFKPPGVDELDNIAENICLAFIFVSRFTFVVMATGWREVVQNKKLELLFYVLFLTHEYPFMLLEYETGVSWEVVQALWHRTTLALCIGSTIHSHMRKNPNKVGLITIPSTVPDRATKLASTTHE